MAPAFPVDMAHRAIIFPGPFYAPTMAHMALGSTGTCSDIFAQNRAKLADFCRFCRCAGMPWDREMVPEEHSHRHSSSWFPTRIGSGKSPAPSI